MDSVEKWERLAKIEQLAKDKYGNDYAHALWGSASCFLEEHEMKIMESVMGK